MNEPKKLDAWGKLGYVAGTLLFMFFIFIAVLACVVIVKALWSAAFS